MTTIVMISGIREPLCRRLDLALRHVGRAFDRDVGSLVGLEVAGRDVHDAVGVDLEGDLHLWLLHSQTQTAQHEFAQ